MSNPVPIRNDGARFDDLVARFYAAWFRFHPEIAVDCGVWDCAGLLTPIDDDQISALISLNEKLLISLEEIDCDALDADRAVDYRVVRGQARIELHDLLERDWRRRDPVGFVPVNALYQLTVRPVPDLPAAMAARLAQIPDYLRAAKGHLWHSPGDVPAVWLDMALQEARAGVDYVRQLNQHPGLAAGGQQRARLQTLLEAAARALEEFARFLQTELAPLAQGGFACGREQFERLLAERHFLAVDAAQLHAFGARLLHDTREELNALLAEQWPALDAEQVAAQIGASDAGANGLLDRYRERMQQAREFVADHALATLPAREQLRVIETPAFLRHQIPFAAYLQPAPTDAEQVGIYYVTPPVGGQSDDEHNTREIAHTSVHEAWPGHHLQFVLAHTRVASRSFPRLVNASATLYEGWALYCEQLMHEQGFLAGPEHRYILLRDRIWRALRVMLDVELQVQGLSVADAATRMQNELGFSRAQALADLAWYTRSPTVPMGYATGWALINAARTQSMTTGLPLREFHDRLLAAGSVGLPLVMEQAFGADASAQALAAVFGGVPAGAPA